MTTPAHRPGRPVNPAAARTGRPARRVAASPAPPHDPLDGLAHRRVSVDPVAPYRLPRATPDGVMRKRGGVLERIVVEDDQIVLLRAAQPGRGADATVVMGAWADDPALADRALARWRRTLGVDNDHRPFLDAVWHDPLLGPLVRTRPWLRPSVRYRPYEALIGAITEQLIEWVEAVRIQRQMTALLGVQCPRTGLRDFPTPRAILDCPPARIEGYGLSGRRTLLMREVCRLLERGLDLDAEPRTDAQRRLRAIPGLGAWTLSVMALRGQGDPDASPSGDLGLLKSVGRLTAAGLVAAPADVVDPTARDRRERLPLASEQQVHDLVSRYSPWKGYAAEHLFHA